MTRSPRQRSDSITAAVAAHQVANTQIAPPEPLSAELMPLWREIVSQRAHDEWLPVDLWLAVTLARTLGSLLEENRKLSDENLLQMTKHHGRAANPRLQIVERLQRRVLALQSRLLLDPRASGFKSDRTAQQRQLEKEARARADPIGSYLANGGDVTALLLGGDEAILFNEILPGAPFDPASPIVRQIRKMRGNGGHKGQ